MKENRLIELLNEYDSWFEYRAYNWKIQRRVSQSKNKRFPVWWNSKSFWFIQWLVQKDKISTFAVDRKIIDSLWRYHWKETTIDRVWNNLDKVLIVLLSISDNPISDLISLLKIEWKKTE